MSNRTTSVVIADDHPIFRDGLERLLQAEADIRVVGTAADGDQALSKTRALHPDILLLDLAMPGRNGIETLRQLHDESSPVRTILLTAALDDDQIVEALRLGARGIVLKETATALLLKCIRVVMAGHYWVGNDDVATLVDALRRTHMLAADPPFNLTPRERQIVNLVAKGATNREIATELGIREDTVKQHLSNMFDKCGVSNRVELALLAVHHRLLSD